MDFSVSVWGGGDGACPKVVGAGRLLGAGEGGVGPKEGAVGDGRLFLCGAFNVLGWVVLAVKWQVFIGWRCDLGVGADWKVLVGEELVHVMWGRRVVGRADRLGGPGLGTGGCGTGSPDTDLVEVYSPRLELEPLESASQGKVRSQARRAWAEVGGPRVEANDVRFSRRLAAKDATPVFLKAIEIRARRDEPECSGAGRRSRRNGKKTLSKSAKCGVLLSEEELNSFLEFEAHKV